MANGLLDLGLSPGDRIGVLEDNSIEAQRPVRRGRRGGPISYECPSTPGTPRRAHVHMLGHTGCRALVVMAAPTPLTSTHGLAMSLPGLEHVVVRDDLVTRTGWAPSRRSTRIPPIDPDDWFIIRHTGGTTGRPQGVAYSHRSWLAAGRDWFYNFPPVRASAMCASMSVPSPTGSEYLFTPIWLSGGTNVLLDRFDPQETLERYGARSRSATCSRFRRC